MTLKKSGRKYYMKNERQCRIRVWNLGYVLVERVDTRGHCWTSDITSEPPASLTASSPELRNKYITSWSKKKPPNKQNKTRKKARRRSWSKPTWKFRSFYRATPRFVILILIQEHKWIWTHDQQSQGILRSRPTAPPCTNPSLYTFSESELWPVFSEHQVFHWWVRCWCHDLMVAAVHTVLCRFEQLHIYFNPGPSWTRVRTTSPTDLQQL